MLTDMLRYGANGRECVCMVPALTKSRHVSTDTVVSCTRLASRVLSMLLSSPARISPFKQFISLGLNNKDAGRYLFAHGRVRLKYPRLALVGGGSCCESAILDSVRSRVHSEAIEAVSCEEVAVVRTALPPCCRARVEEEDNESLLIRLVDLALLGRAGCWEGSGRNVP